MNYAYSAIIANTNAYESLNEADRETFATIIKEEASNITEAFLLDEQAQKESQGDAGMTIVEASDAEIVKAQEALAPFWQEWASEAGPEHEQALQDVLTALGK